MKIRWLLLLTLLSAKAVNTELFDVATINSTRFNNNVEPENVFSTTDGSSGTRIRGMRDGRNADFVLGGLFPVHYDDAGDVCGEFRKPGGLDRVEAMLFALDVINSSPFLLPNITLGYDIRDTCFVEQIGLDEAADLILSGTKNGVETECVRDESSLAAAQNKSKGPYTIGIVGAASSPVSILVAGLSRLFGIPQISYSSTSAALNNHERYPYFFRTIPSDTMEVMAILDLIQHFGWTFISTIFSRNSYGQSGIDDLHKLAAERGICIDLNEGIEETFVDAEYRQLAEKLVGSTANVVVLYSTQQHVQDLFSQLSNLSSGRHYTWIATSAWAGSVKKLDSPQFVSGLFGTLPLFNPQHHFQDYYANLTPLVDPRNPWLREYFHQVLNCTGECTNQSGSPLAGSEQQEYSIPLVIDAVYTFAHALEKYLNDNCDLPVVWNRTTNSCKGQTASINGMGLLQYISTVNFTSPTGNTVTFNRNGGVSTLYYIVNFQAHVDKEGNTNCSLQRIGIWNSSKNESERLMIHTRPQYGVNTDGTLVRRPIDFECGACGPGHYKRQVKDSCCGLCEKCLGELFSNDSHTTQCSNCSAYGEMWGDNSTQGSTGCIEIPKSYLQFSHPFAVIVTIASVIGLILLAVVCVLLGIHWKTPVVMASSRESVILVLIGAGCSFGASFVYLSPPSLTVCTLQRMLLWFCFSLMYGALVVKVVRIARIFVLQKASMKKLFCVQTYHQVIFSLLIVAGQMLIVLLSLSIVHPEVLRELSLNGANPNSLPSIVVTCQPEPLLGLIISVLYEAGLILITVVLGTMTFKSPANFNESKALCVSAYILLSIWTMFFVSYIFTESIQLLQNAFIALTNTLGAYTIICSVIGPRLFIVLFWKERNSRFYSRRATEGDVHVSKDNISTVSGMPVTDVTVVHSRWSRELDKTGVEEEAVSTVAEENFTDQAK